VVLSTRRGHLEKVDTALPGKARVAAVLPLLARRARAGQVVSLAAAAEAAAVR